METNWKVIHNLDIHSITHIPWLAVVPVLFDPLFVIMVSFLIVTVLYQGIFSYNVRFNQEEGTKDNLVHYDRFHTATCAKLWTKIAAYMYICHWPKLIMAHYWMSCWWGFVEQVTEMRSVLAGKANTNSEKNTTTRNCQIFWLSHLEINLGSGNWNGTSLFLVINNTCTLKNSMKK